MNTQEFNARELCSRKLWQLASAGTSSEITDHELTDVIEELAKRRRYLEELQEIGKLEAHPKS